MEKAQFVFSYAREDSDFVLKLAKELRANSVNVWLDQIDIVAGEPWDRAIEEALSICEGVIAVLSPESVASPNVMDEVAYALREQKRIIPVLYRECRIPLRLGRIHHIDFTGDFKHGLDQMFRAVGGVLPPPPPPDGLSRIGDFVQNHPALTFVLLLMILGVIGFILVMLRRAL